MVTSGISRSAECSVLRRCSRGRDLHSVFIGVSVRVCCEHLLKKIRIVLRNWHEIELSSRWSIMQCSRRS
jgi:hypothetical protein